jgi:membrane protein DedA with SNARE-associated domain
MQETLDFLTRHGYALLFLWVFSEQVGVPLPAAPALLAAGALAGAGRLSLLGVVAVAFIASMGADSLWYEIGRRKGGRVLNFLCRISLEPDSCVRRTEEAFARHGARSLLVAKFVPGLSTVAPPLAGIFRMRLRRFVLFNSLGSLVWIGTFVGAGYAFGGQIERLAARASGTGGWFFLGLIAALAIYALGKYLQRRRFIATLRVSRITPEELKGRLDAGEDIVVVDLRHSMDFEAEPEKIPGALHFKPEELEQRHEEIPRDREVVLYCA